MELPLLQEKFKHLPISFKTKNNIVIAEIRSPFSVCELSLYGAHVLSFIPAGEEDLLWMSNTSKFEEGLPIRGGIPICFPWFGPNEIDSRLPQHGFVRLMNWEIESVEEAGQSVKIILTCGDNEFTHRYWKYSFQAKITAVVGKSLQVTLTYVNTDVEPFTCTDALHSYFHISDVKNILVSGLENSAYFQSGHPSLRFHPNEKLKIEGEENRRYIHHSNTCIIRDEGFKRNIVVKKENSHTTVVWNPWEETSQKMPDFHAGGYKKMLCVEAANALIETITLNKGGQFSLSAIISSEKILDNN